jgi:hypothetical protein
LPAAELQCGPIGINADRLAFFLRDSHRKMPNVSLTPAEAANLAAHIGSPKPLGGTRAENLASSNCCPLKLQHPLGNPQLAAGNSPTDKGRLINSLLV